MNCTKGKKRQMREKEDESVVPKKKNIHFGCWRAIRDPVSQKILRIMDPAGTTYTMIPTYCAGKLDFFQWDDFKSQQDSLHPDCWRAVRNPTTNDVTGVIDSFGYIYNIEEDNAEVLIPKWVPKVEVLSFNDLEELSFNDLEEDYHQRGTLVWDLDWGKVTTDLKELTDIYVWCSKTFNDSSTLQYEISTGTKWSQKVSSSGSNHSNSRKVFYMNRSMREARSILQRFALGGTEVDLSACKVMLGEWPNQRSIQVEHCVVADSSLSLSPPSQFPTKNCDTDSPNALIELTVKSRINFGESVTVDIDLEVIRDILEIGESSCNIRGAHKPLDGVASMNDKSMSFSPLPSQHHLKRYENHVSDINCNIIGLAMNVENSYDLKDEFG